MDEKVKRIADWIRTGKLPAPFSVEIRPTILCNLACQFCHRPGPDFYKKEVSQEKYLQTVREAGEMGVVECVLSGGGEPMFKKEVMFEVMKEIKRVGMKGFIITNGTLYTREMIRELVDVGWDYFLLSLDAPDEETQDALRGRPGVFRKNMEMIEQVNADKAGTGRREPQFRILCTLTRMNHDKLVGMVEMAERLGIEGIVLQPMVVRTPESEELTVNEEATPHFQEHLEQAIVRADACGIEHNFPAFRDAKVTEHSSQMGNVIRSDVAEEKENPYLSIPCFSPWLYVGIRPDGTVQPCPIIPDEEINEDIEGKTLQEVWTGDYFSRVRRELASHSVPAYCQRCCGSLVLDTREIREVLREAIE